MKQAPSCQPPQPQLWSCRQRAHVAWVHHHRRRTLLDETAKAGADPRDGCEQREPHDGQDRDHEWLGEIKDDVARRAGAQRQVLAVVPRAIVLPRMVGQVRMVEKRRHEERDAAEHVPRHAKRAERAAAQVDQLVNEQCRAVKRETGDDIADHLHGRKGRGALDQLKAERSHGDRYQTVSPIDRGVGGEQIFDDLPRLADGKVLRTVVARLHRHHRGRIVPKNQDALDRPVGVFDKV
jgi:hypothetical protein